MKQIPHLSTAQAKKRLAEHGPNSLREQETHSVFHLIIEQFANVLTLMLVGASVISIIVGDILDGTLILAIVALNALLGFFQEYKAEKALAALKHMTVGMVKVRRDNTVSEIPSVDLVPGDCILLEEGDKIPADCTILESMHVEVNEAALTGESLSVEKSVTDDPSLSMGTIITHGRATATVTATGMRTKFGAIAEKLATIEEEATPLEKKMTLLGKQLGGIALGAAVVIFVEGFFRNKPFFESLLTAISLAVAAVPEGLPAVVTITLAIGTQRMVRQKAILRKLSAIESLGSVTVIATDKTGTLTQNDMRVERVWEYGKSDYSEMAKAAVLCNSASLSHTKEPSLPRVVGDKTEGALLLYAHALGLPIDELKNNEPIIEEFAFSPDLKRMTVITGSQKASTVYSKGAPESILSLCTAVRVGKTVLPLTEKRKETIEEAYRSFAKDGLRVLACSMRQMSWNGQGRDTVEQQSTFLGILGIADPARPEAKQAVSRAKKAGIVTIMLTGDNELTAARIGSDVGILSRGEDIITGAQLARLSDVEAKKALATTRIIARSTPEQKHRIICLLQQMGHIVAVTGDGVNDALALKQADVGVAMGITGTDVAKEAADMILTDDNYASLVEAIAEGRTIFDNIKSTTKYLLGCNIGEIAVITGGVLLGWPYVLTPLQLLYVNLATDGLPAIGLALTPKQTDIMSRKPRTEKTLFTKHDAFWFMEVGVLASIAVLLAFGIGASVDTTMARSLAFLAVILAQQFVFYDIAARNSTILKLSFRRFPWALLPIGIMIIQAILLEVPYFEHLFGVSAPPALFSLSAVAITSSLLLVSELRKLWWPHLYSHH